MPCAPRAGVVDSGTRGRAKRIAACPTGHHGLVELRPGLGIDDRRLSEFCRRHGVVRIAAFGSVLGEDFGPASDIDLLIAFGHGQVPGLLRLAEMELELATLLGGREVELRTAEDLSPYFRDDVRAKSAVLYAA